MEKLTATEWAIAILKSKVNWAGIILIFVGLLESLLHTGVLENYPLTVSIIGAIVMVLRTKYTDSPVSDKVASHIHGNFPVETEEVHDTAIHEFEEEAKLKIRILDWIRHRKRTDNDTAVKSGEHFSFETLIEAVSSIMRDKRLTKEDLPSVIKVTEMLFEEYVRPINIPKVGPAVERLIFSVLKSSIKGIITAAFSYLPAE